MVVIDGLRRCRKLYTLTEYQQMIGRTGRMGQGKQGRVFVMLEKGDVEVFHSLYCPRQRYTEWKTVRDLQSQEEGEQKNYSCQNSQNSQNSQNKKGQGEGEGNAFLRSAESVKKMILECVAIGVAKTLPDLICLFWRYSLYPFCTTRRRRGGLENGVEREQENTVFLLEYCGGERASFRLSLHPSIDEIHHPLEQLVGRCAIELIDNHFLRMVLPFGEEVSEETQSSVLLNRVHLHVTELGQAVFRSGMTISEVHTLSLALTKLNQSIDISNSLQLIYHLTPITLNVAIPLPIALDYIESNLSEAELQFIHRAILPISTLHQLRGGARVDVCSNIMFTLLLVTQ